jgi:uncharacterized membrane protein YdbT with pleckstrin-like domain
VLPVGHGEIRQANPESRPKKRHVFSQKLPKSAKISAKAYIAFIFLIGLIYLIVMFLIGSAIILSYLSRLH